MAKSRLEGDGLGELRPGAVCLRRRNGSEQLPLALACLVASWGAGALLGARNRGKNITLLASMSVEGMGSSLAVEGTTDREVFEAYVEEVLAPSLQREQIVVKDNLSAHKGERVRELVESMGCELLYLPPYSPDLNPIEEAFSKMKGILRKAEARSREALVEAMGRALDAITLQDARGFFEHCGYRAPGQSL